MHKSGEVAQATIAKLAFISSMTTCYALSVGSRAVFLVDKNFTQYCSSKAVVCYLDSYAGRRKFEGVGDYTPDGPVAEYPSALRKPIPRAVKIRA